MSSWSSVDLLRIVRITSEEDAHMVVKFSKGLMSSSARLIKAAFRFIRGLAV